MVPRPKKPKERRSFRRGGPKSRQVRDLGRREIDWRPLLEKDFGRSIKENWLDCVREHAESLIGNIMDEGVTREKALEILKSDNLFASKGFSENKDGYIVNYIVRYSFRNEQFYWCSTRRVSAKAVRK